jgi:hypothetical protein
VNSKTATRAAERSAPCRLDLAVIRPKIFGMREERLGATAGSMGLVLCSALLGWGCDPQFTLHGTVERPRGEKVAGARVSITCDGLDGGHVEATSDANGAFSASKIGSVQTSCPIDVAVVAEPIRHFPSARYCLDLEGDSCLAIDATLVLE